MRLSDTEMLRGFPKVTQPLAVNIATCSPFIKFVWAIPSLVVFMLSCLPYCPRSILINRSTVIKCLCENCICVLITHLNLIPVNQAYWLISERWPKTGTIRISEDFKAFTKLSYIPTAFSSSHIAVALLEADVGIFCHSIFRRWCWRENRIAPEAHSPRPQVAGRCCSIRRPSSDSPMTRADPCRHLGFGSGHAHAAHHLQAPSATSPQAKCPAQATVGESDQTSPVPTGRPSQPALDRQAALGRS